ASEQDMLAAQSSSICDPSKHKNVVKAIVRDRYGSPDVLTLEELPKPIVKERDVLVRVRAASLNADDLEYLYGKSLFTRMAIGLRAPRIRGLGVDVAG